MAYSGSIKSERKQVEGRRRTLEARTRTPYADADRDAGTLEQQDQGNDADDAGGITNRPLSEEIKQIRRICRARGDGPR